MRQPSTYICSLLGGAHGVHKDLVGVVENIHRADAINVCISALHT